jgi:multiple sugar transport system substrate-binding protein
MKLLPVVRRAGLAILHSLRKSYVPHAVIALVLLGVILYVTAVPQRRAAQDSGVVSIYFADDITPAHQKIIDLFNIEYASRIHVVPISIPFDKFSTNERKELFARFLRSKSDQIDIFAIDGIWIPRFAKWCEPLDTYFTPEERDAVLPESMIPCVCHDTLVAVPLFTDVALLYYRSDLLARLPDASDIEQRLQESITWDKFFDVCRRLRPVSSRPFVFQADNYEGLMCGYVEMLAGLDDPMVEGGNLNLTSPGAVKAAEMLQASIDANAISPSAVTSFRENSSIDYFIRNNAVFLRGWPSFQRDFASWGGDGTFPIDKLRKAPPPHFKGHKPVSMLGGWNLMISRYSTQKPEAVLFLKFLLSKRAQEVLYREGGLLPVNRHLYDDSTFVAECPDLRFYKNLFHTGVRRPALANYTKYSDILSRYLKQAMMQTMSAPAALRQAQAEILADTSSILRSPE